MECDTFLTRCIVSVTNKDSLTPNEQVDVVNGTDHDRIYGTSRHFLIKVTLVMVVLVVD